MRIAAGASERSMLSALQAQNGRAGAEDDARAGCGAGGNVDRIAQAGSSTCSFHSPFAFSSLVFSPLPDFQWPGPEGSVAGMKICHCPSAPILHRQGMRFTP